MDNDDFIYAGFWRRLGALLLDMVFILPVIVILLYVNSHYRLAYLYAFLPNNLLGIFYSVYLVQRFGGTPGKLLVRVKICKSDGNPITYREAILRYLPELTFSALTALALIYASLQISDSEYLYPVRGRMGRFLAHTPFWYRPTRWLYQAWIWSEFVVLLTNRRRRAIHDFIAGTVVVRTGAGGRIIEKSPDREDPYEQYLATTPQARRWRLKKIAFGVVAVLCVIWGINLLILCYPARVPAHSEVVEQRLPGGDVYVGQTNAGKPDGQGTITFANGDQYVGAFTHGKPNGQGTFVSSGITCVGEWKDGVLSGSGTKTYADGTVYTGQFRNAKYNGHGTLTSREGDKYIGEFIDDKYNGQGVLSSPKGDNYAGEFKNSKPNGHGTYTAPDGTTRRGLWQAGTLVKEDASPQSGE